VKIVIYGRPGCHLCDEAGDQIRAITAGMDGVTIETVDIESDDGLMRRYLERIPVVEAGGEEVSELVFDPGPLRVRLGIA
jgi:hypothetical protein